MSRRNTNNTNGAAGRSSRIPELSKNLARLSPSRQALLRPVLENPRAYVLLSARALARRLKVDPATAVRVATKLGFRTYREFQGYLHELSIARATSLDTMQTSVTRDSSPAAHVREGVDRDLRNLQMFRGALDPERIASLGRKIHSAKRIIILGGDLAGNLVGYLHYHLVLLALPSVPATSSGESIHLTRSAGKGEVVIAISFRRGLRQTVEGLRQAKLNGAYCIGITDTLVSPIARFAHECLLVSVDTPAFGASYTAPMSLLNALLTATVYCRRRRSVNLLKRVAEEQRTGFRWYRE